MITPENHKLVAYCERCREYYKFILHIDPTTCPECNSPHSTRIGYQLTTQRTFNPKAKKLTQVQLKKLGA